MQTNDPLSGSSRFRGFLEDNGISLSQAAEALQVTVPSVIQWRDGRFAPRHNSRLCIERWTNGEVPAGSWKRPGEPDPEEIEPFQATVPDGGAAPRQGVPGSSTNPPTPA